MEEEISVDTDVDNGVADAEPDEERLTGAAQASDANWPQRVKYFLVKSATTAGLSFLIPVVLLAYWEEPSRQLTDITRLILGPIIAFSVFLYLWTVLAPLHRTKSGEVPTPAVVLEAAGDILQFHQREGDKEAAYALTGDAREDRLGQVRERLAKVRAFEEALRKLVATREAEAESWATENTQRLNEAVKLRKAEHNAALEARERQLTELGMAKTPNVVKSREAYLEQLRRHAELTAKEQKDLAKLEDQRDTLRAAEYPPLAEVQAKLNDYAEERQHLGALEGQLLRGNRSRKLEAEVTRLKSLQRDVLSATSEEDLEVAAKQVVLSENRIRSIADSNYAKPWTLPMQIQRSVACALCGFVIGSVIAIPIGVLCGLSPSFMSAMTPFIALFKPVSPIVWLPIALIVVGGFIPDPDEHWLIDSLANAPLIGWMKINPAFMASAITVALCSLWATMVNTALGVSSVDQDHLNVARVLRLGFWSRLFKIVIPSSLPLIFAGLRISLGVGWMVLIAGELLSSSEGIGKFVWDQFNNGASDSFAKMIVVVFVVGFIGLLMDRVMIVLQRLVSFDDAAAAL